MKIQATIAGFSGQPVTLLALLDENTGVLVVSKEVTYREERIGEDFALVTNIDLPDCDMRFDNDHMRDAIRTFFTRSAQQTLVIENAVRRYDPNQKIQRDKVTERGQTYELHPDIQNGQVAVLAIIAFTDKNASLDACLEMADELAEFYTAISI